MARTPLDGTHLRAARDADSDQLVALVSAAYSEHPGCVMDLAGVDHDLVAPATTAARRGGRWWVLERDGRIVGSIGTGALDTDGVLELKRCYLEIDLRGRGLATRLITRVEAHASALGASAVELWSDTRFSAAHHRYTSLGYRDTGETRDLHDPSNTTEHRFRKDIVADDEVVPVYLDGPYGEEEVIARELPDGNVLRGRVNGTAYSLEVDHAWRPRRATVWSDGTAATLTSDGAGRWWTEGEPADDLEGCSDAGLALTPTAVQFPIRRLGLGTGESADVRLAMLPYPLAPARDTPAGFFRTGVRSYRQQLDGSHIDIEVDVHGLPVIVGEGWRRRELP